MTILHCLTTKQNYSAIDNCFATIAAQPGAGLVLYQDGVYLADRHSQYASKLLELTQKNIKIYLIKDDIIARGLQNSIINEVNLITYQDFVNLTIEYQKILSW